MIFHEHAHFHQELLFLGQITLARNPDMQTPQCVASPPHNVNFGLAPCVCAAKPCSPCIDLARLTVQKMNMSQNVWKNNHKFDTIHQLSNPTSKTQWQARRTRHQRALTAEDISIDTEENHASRMEITCRLVGQVSVGTQHKKFGNTHMLCNCRKRSFIPVDEGLITHDTLYVCEHCKLFLVEDFFWWVSTNHGEKRRVHT